MDIKEIIKVGMIMMVLGFALNIIEVVSAVNGNEDLVDDIEEFNGSVGPDNALYGLKLAFENIDESFTWNASEKLGKKVEHSRLRISEAKAELRKQNDQAAEKAFEQYREKVRETEESFSDLSENDSGISKAQIMIEKNQYVLEQLIESHPNNTGLRNAYNKSQELKDKFEQKTDRKIERIKTNEGKNILREIKKEKEDNKEDDFKDSGEFKINVKISGNDSRIKIELKSETNSTDNATIARDILNELRLTRDNISTYLRIENGTEASFKESLEADAQIRMNVSNVELQYMFALNETNRTEIIDGIYEKLSALTPDKIQAVLKIKVWQEEKNEEKVNKTDKIDKEDRTNKTAMENKENIREDKEKEKVETQDKRENRIQSKEDKTEDKTENRKKNGSRRNYPDDN